MDKWDKRFMEIAKSVATWTSCYKPNRAVGAVIVRDKRILTTGYNGAPEGVKTCMERQECLRVRMGIESGTRQEVCYAVHAEQNAVVQAARIGISLVGATIYVTHCPCTICTKIIINAGIKRVVYLNDYPDDFSKLLLADAGIPLEKF